MGESTKRIERLVTMRSKEESTQQKEEGTGSLVKQPAWAQERGSRYSVSAHVLPFSKSTTDPPKATGGTQQLSFESTVEQNEKEKWYQRSQHYSKKKIDELGDEQEQGMRAAVECNRSRKMGVTDEANDLMMKQGNESRHQSYRKKTKLDLLGCTADPNTTAGRKELKKQSLTRVITAGATILAKIDTTPEDERKPPLRKGVESDKEVSAGSASQTLKDPPRVDTDVALQADTEVSEATTTPPLSGTAPPGLASQTPDDATRIDSDIASEAVTTQPPPGTTAPRPPKAPLRVDSDIAVDVSMGSRLGRHLTTEVAATPSVTESVRACAAGLNTPPNPGSAPPRHQEDQTTRDPPAATRHKLPVNHSLPTPTATKAKNCEKEETEKQVHVKKARTHRREQKAEAHQPAHDPTPPPVPDRHQVYETGRDGGLTEEQRQIVLAHESELRREIIEIRQRREFLPPPAGTHDSTPPSGAAGCGRDARAAGNSHVSEREERRLTRLGLENPLLMQRSPVANEGRRGSHRCVERQTILVEEIHQQEHRALDASHAAPRQDTRPSAGEQSFPQPSSYQEAFLQIRHSNDLLLLELAERGKSRENEKSSALGTSERLEAVAVENTQLKDHIRVLEQKIAREREAVKEEKQRTAEACRRRGLAPVLPIDQGPSFDFVIREGDSKETKESKRKHVEFSVRLEQTANERDTLLLVCKDTKKKNVLLESEIYRLHAECKTYETESIALTSDLQESKQRIDRLEAGLTHSMRTHERLTGRFQVLEATRYALRKQAEKRGILPQADVVKL